MTTTNRWRPEPPPDLEPAGLGRAARLAIIVWVVGSLLIAGWVLFVPPSPAGGGPDCGTTVTFEGVDAEADTFSRGRACDLAEQEQRWLGLWLILALGLGAVIVVRIGRWRANDEAEPPAPGSDELRPPDGFRERALAGPTEPVVDGPPPGRARDRRTT